MLAPWLFASLFVHQEVQNEFVHEVLPEGFVAEYAVLELPDGSSVRHGPFTLIDTEGLIRAEGEYVEGKRDRNWVFSYPNGRTQLRAKYRNGERTGSWTYFFEDGEVRAKGKYAKGELDGKWRFNDPGGNIQPVNSGRYELAEVRHPDGSLRGRGYLVDGLPHGCWDFFWPNGGPMLQAQFERGRDLGCWGFQHPNGLLDPWFLDPGPPQSEWPVLLESDPLPLGEPTDEESELASIELEWDPACYEGQLFLPEPTERDLKLTAEAVENRGFAGGHERTRSRGEIAPALAQLRAIDYGDREERSKARSLLQWVDGKLSLAVLLMTDPPRGSRALRCSVCRVHGALAISWAATDTLMLDLRHSKYWIESLAPGVRQQLANPPRFLLPELTRPAAPDLYAQRVDRAKRDSDEAVAAGLAWLAQAQERDGSWTSGDDNHRMGMTALVLLAFLGEGHSLDRGEYSSTIAGAVDFMLDWQSPKTGQFYCSKRSLKPGETATDPAQSYDHALATLALAELSALSECQSVRWALTSAVDFIGEGRSPYGAWRYDTPSSGDEDTSVTGWMVQALLAAEAVGVTPNKSEWRAGALDWLNRTTDETGICGYIDRGGLSSRPATGKRFPSDRNRPMTAVALFCRVAMNPSDYDLPVVELHTERLLETLPATNRDRTDYYAWFYGSHALRLRGGKPWARWEKALLKAALPIQVMSGPEEGSWDPTSAWGVTNGRVYATAMVILALQSPYRLDLGLEER